MRVAWVWRHPQSAEYMLATDDARFEAITYLARQNEVYCIAPARDHVFQTKRWGQPHSGEAMVVCQPDFNGVVEAVRQIAPEVIVVEGAPAEAEWLAIREAAPDAFFALYYGGGPLWNAEGAAPPMLDLFDVIFVPHEAQRRRLMGYGLTNVVKAYGVPAHIFRPMPEIPKVFHALYPANFSVGKRQPLVAQYLEQYPQQKPSLLMGKFEDMNVLDMARCGGVPMNMPGPPRNTAIIGGRTTQRLMPWVYNMAEVLISGSQEEGHPNCVMEAMACGVPAIVMSDCLWDVAAAFEDLEGGAYYPGIQVVDPSPTAIMKAVEVVLENPQLAARAARRAMVEQYDWWSMYWNLDLALRNGLALKLAGQKLSELQP